ncbi:MAG: EAL domain-containing protein [Treponemataceae bacterium]|nr:EAL domain-containing protein [Treponemataceae bacterium]
MKKYISDFAANANGSQRKQAPKWAFVLIILLYALTLLLVIGVARKSGSLSLFGRDISVQVFSGVFASLGNICIIFLVVFFRKIGFITSFVILLLQFPVLMVRFFLHHVNLTLPGLFTNIFTLSAVVIIYMNNSRIEQYQEKIRCQAVTDALTNLPNRFALTELVEDLVSKNIKFTVVSIDLNNFKSINDTMGHDIGNKVLVELASRWKKLAEDSLAKTDDFVARLGGDEFSIVIRNYKDQDELIKRINTYKEELERTITIEDCDYFLSACFGYAENPCDSVKGVCLLCCADAALYEAKKQGLSSCVLRFSPDYLQTERILDIERKIRTALADDTLFFYLQPQYDMNHKLRGFEALARMKDSDGAFISPGEFIPVAEKIGLIDRVDMIVFKKAADFFALLLKKGNPDIILSFNVSVRHLMKNNFIEEIKEVISSSGVPSDHLELEITESIMIDSAEKALSRINEVKKMGIKVAIDDFGTGYSSLSYLNTLPSDLLKIDKSFIDAMNSSESSKQYVASIVTIGHVLNIKVISEGVESPEQLETLRNIGCDYIQGFIWGKPLPPEEASELV